MSSLLPQLAEAAQGLWYISENEAPLEHFTLPAGTPVSSSEEFLAAIGRPGAPVEEVTLAHFFRNHVRTDLDPSQQETAQRFQALQAWLEKNLQEVRVYRVGQVQIQAYVLGKTPDGAWLGLQTELIET